MCLQRYITYVFEMFFWSFKYDETHKCLSSKIMFVILFNENDFFVQNELLLKYLK